MANRTRCGPISCLEHKPTHKTIRLGGRYISLTLIEREMGLDHGYVSYIFSGKRIPSIPYAEKLADALGMTLDDLLWAIRQRRKELDEKYQRQLAS
jgi:transcriptional regulator with XRE-family HTH domain